MTGGIDWDRFGAVLRASLSQLPASCASFEGLVACYAETLRALSVAGASDEQIQQFFATMGHAESRERTAMTIDEARTHGAALVLAWQCFDAARAAGGDRVH